MTRTKKENNTHFFKLTISCDNEAFGQTLCDRKEAIVKVLAQACAKILAHPSSEGETILLDVNGNSVGSFVIT